MASSSFHCSDLWSDPNQASSILGAIQRDRGVGLGKMVFVALPYTITSVDVQTMMETLWRSWAAAKRASARWPFVPTQTQCNLLFPHGPYEQPWHPMAEVIMTKALEWCCEHQSVTMTDEVFCTIVEHATAA